MRSMIAAAVLALVPAGATAGTTPPLGADAIFAAAQTAAARAVYPPYASYTVDVAFTIGARRVHDSWQTVENLRLAKVFVARFSAQEIAHPSTPHGSDIVVPLAGTLNSERDDPIGSVAFAVDQTFGVAPQRAYLSGRDLDGGASPPPRTFRVTSGAAAPGALYRVQLLGTVAGDHGSDYHLKLSPLFDPGRDRLRELWIATETMALDAAIVAGIGNRPPATNALWNVTYATTGGAPYIAREAALAPLEDGRVSLRDATIDFGDVQPAQDVPARYAINEQAPDPLRDP